MKDYRIILTLDGSTGKMRIEGNYYPPEGQWEIEDHKKALDMLKFGDNWHRKCIVELKREKIKLDKEIDEMTEGEGRG